MNEEIKAEWTKRLRSGNIPQRTGNLGHVDGSRCCLGVLCDIAVEKDIMMAPTVDDNGVLSYDNNTGVLPLRVVRWAEIPPDAYDQDNVAGYYGGKGLYGTNKHALADDNDHGKTFVEISNIINTEF